ncbi:MAG: substrate-binding domain-containing protein [Ruminococcus sp.]|nr:substrate-binding domain-containing protein [Ruminococcus sp.]
MNPNEEKTARVMNKPVKVVLTILAFVLFSVLYGAVTLVLIYNHTDPMLAICAALTAVVAGAETLLLRRLKAPKYILTPSLFVPAAVLFAILFFGPTGVIDIYDVIFSLPVCAMLGTVRCAVAVIDSIVAKKAVPAVCFIVATVIFIFAGLDFVVNGYRIDNAIVKYFEEVSGGADRTGSWSSINQEVGRDKNWQQIVKNSAFQFGKSGKQFDEDWGGERVTRERGTYPNIDGSTVCVPMGAEFARQHLGMDDETCNDFVMFSTTHNAYENLISRVIMENNYWYAGSVYTKLTPNKSIDLVLGTEPSDEELAMAKKANVELVKKPVCFDAFVFITHKDNPIESLTVEQVRDIYSGKIKNWKEVGGKNEKIVAYQREENSGSQTAMENLVMGGRDMIDPIEIKVIAGMGTLVDAVAEYKNKTASLGYTYRYYIDTLYKNDNIKTIAINGIAPTDDNIRSEKYPFTTNYYGVIRHGDENEVGGKFLDWMLTDEGQKCIAQAGYITVREIRS